MSVFSELVFDLPVDPGVAYRFMFSYLGYADRMEIHHDAHPAVGPGLLANHDRFPRSSGWMDEGVRPSDRFAVCHHRHDRWQFGAASADVCIGMGCYFWELGKTYGYLMILSSIVSERSELIEHHHHIS